MSTLATCRFCGAQGYEDEGDLAPGVCPECFDKRMAVATVDLWTYLQGTHTKDEAIAEGVRLLVAAGMTQKGATAFARMAAS